jgi:O-acetyl-ADP-ribose deacetylase (regulator of RNase III)
VARITLVEGDISEQEVDAIVNAANSHLILGAGVAGAIREKGGPTIQQQCDEIGLIEVGAAAITDGGELPAKYVIHAAGMAPGGVADEQSVRKSLRASLEIAARENLTTIAIPAIGTGVGGLSLQRCAEVSLEEARAYTGDGTSLEEIRFVLYGEPAFRLFEMVNDAAKVAVQMERLAKMRERD